MKLLALLFPVLALGADQVSYQVYKLKKGDTISEVLYSKNFKPLYGEKGWVNKTLAFNRINGIDATKLEKEQLLILPSAPSIDFLPKQIDKVQLQASAPERTGVFAGQKFNKYNFTLAANVSKKERKIENRTINNSDSYFYEAGLSMERVRPQKIGKIEYYPQFGIKIGSQRSFEIEAEKYSFAEFNTDIEASSSFFLRNGGWKLGPSLSASETSELDSYKNSYMVRRDQNLWIGAAAKRTIHQNYLLEFSADYNIYSRNLNSLPTDEIAKFSAKGSMNLLDGFYFGVFGRKEIIDRDNTTVGAEISYLLN